MQSHIRWAEKKLGRRLHQENDGGYLVTDVELDKLAAPTVSPLTLILLFVAGYALAYSVNLFLGVIK